MATTTIYATTNTNGRGIISVSNSDWDDAINATAGSVQTSTSNNFAIRGGAVTGRGGTEYRVWRTFAYFDLSSITTTITAATVKVYGAGSVTNGGTAQMYASTAFGNNGTALASTDFDNVSSTLYSGTSFNEITWNKSGLNSFTVNATGISAMNLNGILNVCFRNDNDVDEETPTSDHYLGVNFQTSGTNRIQVVITHNDPGYGNKVIDVAASSIGEINEVPTANIEKVIDA